jgi:hypothetical protein
VGDLVAFVEAVDADRFERGGVDEGVLATVVRGNEAKALSGVIELYGAIDHGGDFVSFLTERAGSDVCSESKSFAPITLLDANRSLQNLDRQEEANVI